LAESPAQRLSKQEVLCQISTFIAAGHETTSNALSWTLYALARDPRVQEKLRAELRSIPLPANSTPTSPTPLSNAPLDPPLPSLSPSLTDDIRALPYLDSVVRESLRLHAPITSTMRVCAADDVIPVAEPFVDKHGQVRAEIQVKKHDIVSIPIQAINRNERAWGPDAGEFR
jgi:cytochrome P450